MGHLNVRFHVAHAVDGLAGFAAALGAQPVYSPRAESTLMVREHHIRFLKEARVGDPMRLSCGLLDLESDGALLLQTLRHGISGEVQAVFHTSIAHARARDGQAFPWSTRVRGHADALKVAAPEALRPRSLTPGDGRVEANVELAGRLRLERHALGVFGTDDCDVFGRVRASEIMGRLGDASAYPMAAVRAAVGEGLGGARIGMAVVEYRLTYIDWPRAGDRYDLRTACTEVEPRRLKYEHWILDPESGRAWAAADVVLVVFDLDKRKTVTLPDAAVAELRKAVVAL